LFDVDKQQFKTEMPRNNESQSVVNVIVKDEDRLFLSTDEGVFAYSLQTHESTLFYTSANANYTRYIHITLDKSHQLWICGSTLDVYDAHTLKKRNPMRLKN
jgi:hypothetical protein